TSEGQSYGMFFALVHNDRELFARVPVQASADAATAANSERRCRSGTEGGSVGFEPVIVGSVSGARVVT
ncbi:hypothetical protein APR50_37250, partial [Variovorax paradoxus]|uniref:hypothetical protein n=1 Tax=Variovorax paradoxus TaxID=34073 RepID=UPI0006E5637F